MQGNSVEANEARKKFARFQEGQKPTLVRESRVSG